MAKVTGTVVGETIHTVELKQRELDIIVSILGEFHHAGETSDIFDALKGNRQHRVKFVDGDGNNLPCILIDKEE